MMKVGAEIIEGTEKFDGLLADPGRAERMREQALRLERLRALHQSIGGCK